MKAVILFVLVMTAVNPAMAASVESYDGIIEINGTLDPQTLPELRNAFNKISARVSSELKLTVLVSSDGGLLASALNLSGFLRWLQDTHKVEVKIIIPSGESCASACLVLFAAGGTRIAHSTSEFGFHAVHNGTPGDQSGVDVQESKSRYAEAIARASAGLMKYLSESGWLERTEAEWADSARLAKIAPDFLSVNDSEANIAMRTHSGF